MNHVDEEIIRVKHLTKRYYTYNRGNTFKEVFLSLFKRQKVVVTAVNDISFDIKRGDIVGLLGKNGAGKSSIIKILTGVLFPTEGQVSVLGYLPAKQRVKYVAHIGAVFGQKSQLIWDIPPLDSFYMNKAIYDIGDEAFQQQLTYMAGLFEVEDIMKKPTRVLSLGERMKCEFIMAMLHRPQVVFLDEPTIGLDMLAKEKIRNFILEMNKSGVTFILTTHDIEDIEALANKIIIINHGEKVFEDTLNQLKCHLGQKKNVNVITRLRLPVVDIPGVISVERLSDCEMNLLVDLSLVSMNDFLVDLNQLGEIVDISIKELSVEEIIKTIYQTM